MTASFRKWCALCVSSLWDTSLVLVRHRIGNSSPSSHFIRKDIPNRKRGLLLVTMPFILQIFTFHGMMSFVLDVLKFDIPKISAKAPRNTKKASFLHFFCEILLPLAVHLEERLTVSQSVS